MNLIRWTAVAGMLVATGACSEAIAPTSSTTVGANLVRLTVSASSTEVVRGSLATVEITLVNEGSEPVTLHFGDSCQILPYLRNGFGKVVIPEVGGWGCLTVLTQLTLLPQQPVVRQYFWIGTAAFLTQRPMFSLPPGPRFLSPGKYFLSAEVPSAEAMLRATTEVTLK